MHILRLFFHAHRINPLTSYFTDGISPYAAWSLMQTVNTLAQTNFKHVGIIQHEYRSGINENIKRGYDQDRDPAPLPMTAERFSDVSLSLYFASSEHVTEDQIDTISTHLPGLRFQGGHIQNAQPLSLTNLTHVDDDDLEDPEAAFFALRDFVNNQETSHPDSKNPFSVLFLKSTDVPHPTNIDAWATAIADGNLLVPVGYVKNLLTQDELSSAFNTPVVAVEPIFTLVSPLKRYLLSNTPPPQSSFFDQFFFSYNHSAPPTLHALV